MISDISDEIPVFLTNDLETKIAEHFLIMDNVGNKTIEHKDVGFVLRSLGCCPLEADIAELCFKTRDKDFPNIMHLAYFLPYVCKMLFEHRMEPVSPERLYFDMLQLDKEKKGYIEIEYLCDLLMAECEPLTIEEIDTFLTVAVDPYTEKIDYEFLVQKLKHVVPPERNIYVLADRVKKELPPPPPRRLSTI